MLTLVASAMAGGDCIDGTDALRAGGSVGVLGCVVKAPSTLGTPPRRSRWGQVRRPGLDCGSGRGSRHSSVQNRASQGLVIAPF